MTLLYGVAVAPSKHHVLLSSARHRGRSRSGNLQHQQTTL